MSLEKEKFEYLLRCIDDKMVDLFYYDRKECDIIETKDIENISDEQYKLIVKRLSEVVGTFMKDKG